MSKRNYSEEENARMGSRPKIAMFVRNTWVKRRNEFGEQDRVPVVQFTVGRAKINLHLEDLEILTDPTNVEWLVQEATQRLDWPNRRGERKSEAAMRRTEGKA